MKYILTESQISNLRNYITTVFEIVFGDENLMYGPSEEDGEMDEDTWEFYIPKKYGKENVFTWYDDDKPIVKIYGNTANELDEKFGDTWQPIFKEWFKDTFGKEVEVLKY